MCADSNNTVLSHLECPICLEYMSAPIFVCLKGHSICNKCKIRIKNCPLCGTSFGSTRNFTLESLIEALPPLPSTDNVVCPFARNGCNAEVTQDNVNEHKIRCPFRQFRCLFYMDSKQCEFRGKRQQLKHHLQQQHSTEHFDYVKDMNNIELPQQYDLFFTYFENDIFYLHCRQEEGMLYWWLQHIGHADRALDYSYRIRVFTRPYAHRECQATERCVNDVENFQDVIKLGKCAALPVKNIETYPEELWYTLHVTKLTKSNR